MGPPSQTSTPVDLNHPPARAPVLLQTKDHPNPHIPKQGPQRLPHTLPLRAESSSSPTQETSPGYGYTTPLTDAGKAFSIAFALLGVPATMLLLTVSAQRLSLLLTHAPLSWLSQRWGWDRRRAARWHLAVLLGVVVIICFLVPAAVFAHLEEAWSFLDAFYFCFISLSTIGLGDYVPGEAPGQPYRALYRVLVAAYLFLGLVAMVLVLQTVRRVSDLHGLTELILLRNPCPTSLDQDEEDRVDILDPRSEPHQQLTAGSHTDYASISSHFARCPEMSPAWPRLRVLRALRALLVVLLAPWRLWAIKDTQDCTWQVALNKFDAIGENHTSDRFFYQEPLDTVDEVFSLLVDAPIDPDKTYLGFPYYLKINYSCKREFSEALVRKGHLTGLKPMVLVSFQSPVNFYHWKIEQLQIQMEAAPFRSKELCNAEEVCVMSWYTPMPIKNGSVVMRVDVSSNGLGPFIPNKSFRVNINGFLERQQDNTLRFTVGNELFNLIPRYFVNVPSRPLWYTVDQAPVLILGGIPEEKSILLTDTNFKDFFLVELSIDNCWVGSFCPQASFTATIYDAIATESTLFIRQNQLVYYFTGTYITLHESNHGSGPFDGGKTFTC
ncbi:hypothetical protein CB1_000482018 [Camelus ferus]|nr:hypothetical protein CB1_000482018 [Camelus ferus]